MDKLTASDYTTHEELLEADYFPALIRKRIGKDCIMRMIAYSHKTNTDTHVVTEGNSIIISILSFNNGALAASYIRKTLTGPKLKCEN